MSPAGHLCFRGTAVAAPPRPGPRPFHAPTRRGGRGACLSCIPFLPPPPLPVSFQAQLPEVKSLHLPGSRHTVIGGRRPALAEGPLLLRPQKGSPAGLRRPVLVARAGADWFRVWSAVVSVSTSSAVRRSHAFSYSFCSARRCEDPSESLHLFGSNRCSVSTGRVLPTTATPPTHTHLGDGRAAPRGAGRTSHPPAGSAVCSGPQLPLLAALPGLLPGQHASRDSGRGCQAGLPA